MVDIPSKAAFSHIPRTGGIRITEETWVDLDHTAGTEGVATSLPNDYQALIGPLVRSRLSFLRRDWLKKIVQTTRLTLSQMVRFFRSSANQIGLTTSIISWYKDYQEDVVLSYCIQSLLTKDTIEKVRSLGFYSYLFLFQNLKINRFQSLT